MVQPPSSPFSRFLKAFRIKARYLLDNLLSGDRAWGRLRFVAVTILFIVLLVLVYFIAEGTIPAIVDALRNIFVKTTTPPPVGTLPTPIPQPTVVSPPGPLEEILQQFSDMLGDIIQFLHDTFWLPFWEYLAGSENKVGRARFLLVPFIVMVLVILNGARYIQDIYELKSYAAALRYLLASMFGILPYPRLRISDGKKVLKAGEENALDIIGGPGYITIEPGNLVLFERLHEPSAVRSAGRHFVSRFEKIAEIVNLEEQQSELEEVKAITRDGIQVFAKNVKYRYRLHPGSRYAGPAGRVMTDPYPFSVKGVVNMVYNRNMLATGYTPWEKAIGLAVDTAISDYMAATTLERLIAPSIHKNEKKDPRKEIREQLDKPGFRANLRNNFGTELIFCDIGSFEPKEKELYNHRIKTWQAQWVAQAESERVTSQIETTKNQDIERAKAQAALLIRIARALQDAGTEAEVQRNLPKIILTKTAQILDAVVEKGHTVSNTAAAKPPEAPPQKTMP